MAVRSEPDGTVNIGVSKALYDVKSGLVAAGGDLENLVHSRVSWLVRDMRAALESSTCRIAFVGQIKAGKSSLINALINKPGFLPTDINPSTAVVTKVFIGGSDEKDNTALFHFFTESEWDNIMSAGQAGAGGRSLLTLPSSRARLQDLQRRAEKRLGPNYSKALGKHHLFSAVTPQILDQYVSASDYKPDAPDGPALYSDVTKMAEVFLKSPPFSHPTVMIDTPGVNDLFFIRDEITHSNLADADIYILVLSAQNPLSSADVSLLRLLRGLQRDRIIAVINRIDSLDNIADDSRKVEAFVREKLKHEFPHASIPVLLASALWANAALSSDGTLVKRVCNANFDRYVQESGIVRQAGAEDLHCPSTLLASSGIPRVVDFISRFIMNSVTEDQLLPTAATFAAIAHNTAMSSRLALRALAPDRLIKNTLPALRDELKRQAQLSLDQLSEVVREVDDFLNGILKEWEAHANEELVNLERYLFYSIDIFADTQAKAFMSLKDPQSFTARFFKDALQFRSELSDKFAWHHTQISKGLLDRKTEAEAALRETLQAKLPNLDTVIQFGLSSRKTRALSVMALAKATSLETAEFWALLKHPSEGDEAARIREIKLVIASEFVLIVKELLDTAQSDLKMTANEMMMKLRVLALSAIFPLIDNLSYLADEFLKRKGLSASGSPIDGDFLQDFQSRIRSNVKRQQEVAERLVKIKKQSLQVPAG
jgi:GTP-binding protein EngB required for normal cell division